VIVQVRALRHVHEKRVQLERIRSRILERACGALLSREWLAAG
jgi:hypothetical protein